MYDLEESVERLKIATESGVEHFCFFLEDPITLKPSFFYWYGTAGALYEALTEDLWAVLFTDPEDAEVELFISEMQNLIIEVKNKKIPEFFELTKRIQDVWNEFENASNFNFVYVGTYELLCQGSNSFECLIRDQFRRGKAGTSDFQVAAIAENETDEFNNFISSEI